VPDPITEAANGHTALRQRSIHRGIHLLPDVAFLLGAHFISVSFPSIA
jgi:hypothetical protein